MFLPEPEMRALADADLGAADRTACTDLLADARRVRGWLDAREAAITARLRELHDDDGGAPAADVHTRCGGVSAAEGKRRERRSETIDEAPAFGEALADGRIGAEHVDALANATSKLDDDVKAGVLDSADDLLSDAERLSPERFGRSVRELARRLEADNGIERNQRQRRETFLTRRLNPATGMTEGRFALHPELANQIFGAIDRDVAAMVADGTRRGDPEFVEPRVDRNRLAAEAWGRLVSTGHDRQRPLEADITIIIDAGTMTTGQLHDQSTCETGDGAELPPASVRRLLPTRRVTLMMIDQSGVALDAGRTIHHANRKQRRALRAMYRCCAFGDCDVPFDRCEIHHIIPWELSGPTDLINLIPLCSRHHHLVHDHNWILELLADRTLIARQRDGTEFGRWPPDRLEHHRRQPAA